MEELLIVNPRRRRRAHNPRRSHRTAAQRAATRRMIAANRARRMGNPRRRTYHARRRHNPVAEVGLMNPRRRRRYATHHRRHYRRRNPAGGAMTRLFMSAFTGAVGAVAVNAVYNYLPLPATLKTGYTSYAVKGAFAVALGLWGRRLLGANATKMAEGSLTVTLTGLMAQLGATAGLNLSEVSYYSPAVQYAPRPAVGYQAPQMSEYVGLGEMGEYVQ